MVTTKASEKIIPVIIYHEGNPKYLRYCIRQAQKYNKEVVLLGDNSNRYLNPNAWYDVTKFNSKEWEEFNLYFCNMSTNPENFEKFCFKRLFVINELFKNGLLKDCCFLIDSDVLCYTNFSTIPIFQEYDVSLSSKKNQDHYCWSAHSGSSFWTAHALSDFCSFCIDLYQNRKKILEKKWTYHQKNNLLGGICDMTLLYLWTLEYSGRILNTTKIFGTKYVMDAGIGDPSNYNKNEFEFNKILGIKKVRFKNKTPYLRYKRNGEDIQTLVLHFGGAPLVKIYIPFFTNYHFINHILIYATVVILKTLDKLKQF